MRTEFDRYGETYEAAVEEAISFAGKEHDFYLEAKARRLLELTRRHLGGGRAPAIPGGSTGRFRRTRGRSPHVLTPAPHAARRPRLRLRRGCRAARPPRARAALPRGGPRGPWHRVPALLPLARRQDRA